jgi:hypothetical protein
MYGEANHSAIAFWFGRALTRQRLFAKVPLGHWKTATFLAALPVSGLSPTERNWFICRRTVRI